MSFLQKEISLPKLRAPTVRKPTLRPRRSSPAPRRPAAHRRLPARRSSGVVGLEIGATQLLAAQAHLLDGRVVADRVASRSIPDGLVRDGLVADPDGLSHELKDLFAEARLPKRVRVGLATPRTILRVIDLPPLEEADVRTALQLQAQDRIPMPLEKAVLDHQTIGLVDTPEGKRLRVVVVVSEREGVEQLLDTLKQAGLRAEGIDLSVFAAMRVVSGAHPEPGPMLYAQLGDFVNIAIADGGVCHFTRQAPQGLGMVIDRLSTLVDCTPEEARTLLQTVVGGAARTGVGEIGSVLSQIAFELGSELRAAAEFYAAQFGSGAISSGVVTGALAPLTGFVPALADASGIDLHTGEVSVARTDTLGIVQASVAPVAAGLAVARVHA